jgi:ATP-dependent Lon protease
VTVHTTDKEVEIVAHKQTYSGISIKSVGKGEYFGFMLDGNERFVLGNFVVTHNTSLVKNGICKALGLPFSFIALGGASDGSYLDGHSYTYEGSTWGKVVDILMKAKCMNPVMYFDELDKVSYTYKGEEIINILIHLTDSTQNDRYQDKYFTDVEFDISRCLVIFSYNDESAINPILKDRMIRIQTEGYKIDDKLVIAKKYLIPDLMDLFKFNTDDIHFSDDIIRYIVLNMAEQEEGVRNLKRALESIVSNINLAVLLNPAETTLPIRITEKMVHKYLKHPSRDNNHKMMSMYS